ncbi:TPA: hypothetical protein HA265_07190 [Candidatus Woesearchaeota archaeon]|nr:hypothetical protein [Candidatus Woesearchaeota archaeon]
MRKIIVSIAVLLVAVLFLAGCGERAGEAWKSLPEEKTLARDAKVDVKVGAKADFLFYSDKCSGSCIATVDSVKYMDGHGVWVDSKDRDPNQDRPQLLWGLSATNKDSEGKIMYDTIRIGHPVQAKAASLKSVKQMKAGIEFRDRDTGKFIDGQEVLFRLV